LNFITDQKSGHQDFHFLKPLNEFVVSSEFDHGLGLGVKYCEIVMDWGHWGTLEVNIKNHNELGQNPD
jgi:hypothetical protein